MKYLWAPWRMQYIEGEKPKGCIFCEKPKEQRDRENLILYRAPRTYVILNRYPYNTGHLMVVPYDHVDRLEALPDEVLLELLQNTRRCLAALRQAFSPEGFNVGFNLGKVAGAGIEEHLHIHIVPRWSGDTNFMPVLAETKVIPQDLATTYEVLSPLLAAPERGGPSEGSPP